MKIARTETFVENYRKLPAHIRKKVDKQIRFLVIDMSHPSLRVKKCVDWIVLKLVLIDHIALLLKR